jgi:hypothetical protein
MNTVQLSGAAMKKIWLLLYYLPSMKIFILSRRFLLPLFITWILHLGYAAWDMWRLYRYDFESKNMPASVKAEWLWGVVAGRVLITTFLLAFLVAMTWYSHYRMKKESGYRPFALAPVLLVTGIAIAGFVYTSFCQPRITQRNMRLLSAVIYSGTLRDFSMEIKNFPEIFKAPKAMTLPELLYARNELAREAMEPPTNPAFGNMLHRDRKEIAYLIAEKEGLPVTIILFYILAVFLGASFRRVHLLFPLLIAYFIVFAGWYFGQEFSHKAYWREKLGAFWAANLMTLVLGIIALGWFFILQKRGVFRQKETENREIEA